MSVRTSPRGLQTHLGHRQRHRRRPRHRLFRLFGGAEIVFEGTSAQATAQWAWRYLQTVFPVVVEVVRKAKFVEFSTANCSFVH